jgi:hypothetical protein
MANTQILYLEATKRDFIDKFLMKQQGYFLRPKDNKIDFNMRAHPDPPWLYVKSNYRQNCHYWHRQLFDWVLDKSKVPTPCLSCWKVVVKPRNIAELMAVYLMQRNLDKASKCGTEGDRDNTDRLYGGYWYNWSQEQAQRRFEEVYLEIQKGLTYEAKILGCPIKERFLVPGDKMEWSFGTVEITETLPVIMKRGCTEYEQHCGPSDKWEADEDQVDTETYAASSFVRDPIDFGQNEMMVSHVWKAFIHQAWQWGDQSYLRFTNGNRLFMPPVTYHNMDFLEKKTVIEKKSTKEVHKNG